MTSPNTQTSFAKDVASSCDFLILPQNFSIHKNTSKKINKYSPSSALNKISSDSPILFPFLSVILPSLILSPNCYSQVAETMACHFTSPLFPRYIYGESFLDYRALSKMHLPFTALPLSESPIPARKSRP